jgi:hypothetical protein
MLDIALEIPLAAFGLGRLGQSNVARRTRVEVLAHRSDGAALAGGVTALEQDAGALAALGQMRLQQHQLLLQRIHLFFIDRRYRAYRRKGSRPRSMALSLMALGSSGFSMSKP